MSRPPSSAARPSLTGVCGASPTADRGALRRRCDGMIKPQSNRIPAPVRRTCPAGPTHHVWALSRGHESMKGTAPRRSRNPSQNGRAGPVAAVSPRRRADRTQQPSLMPRTPSSGKNRPGNRIAGSRASRLTRSVRPARRFACPQAARVVFVRMTRCQNVAMTVQVPRQPTNSAPFKPKFKVDTPCARLKMMRYTQLPKA